MTTMISKSYTATHFGPSPSALEKVEIFRDRVIGWQLDIARDLIKQIDAKPTHPVMNHAGYAVLSILLSYFEMIWQHIDGSSSDGKSGDYFAEGFKHVYKNKPHLSSLSLGRIKKRVYRPLRCGMYHDGYTKKGVTISHAYPEDFSLVGPQGLQVNPHSLVGTLEKHFADYLGTLNLNSPEMTKFLTIFDQTLPVIPGNAPPPSSAPPPQPPTPPQGYQQPSSPSGTYPAQPWNPSGPSGGQGGPPFGGAGGPPPSGSL